MITKAKPGVLCGLGVAVLVVAFLCASCGTTAAESSTTNSTAAPTSTVAPASTTAPSSTTAPTSPSTPLLSLLYGIPERPLSQSEDFVYFADYAAMESAYDAIRPADAEQVANISTADQAHQVWWTVFQNSWSFSQYWLASLESGPQEVGFSPLEVDQAIRFGVAPGDGLMLAGRFDADAIRTAYQANVGLSPKDFGGTTVWLRGEDPADGFQVDPSNVLRANPFGGGLGRRQPLIISDDLLMSSADLELVLAHPGAAAGTVPNLADAPGYRAAVNAVSEDADVLQAAIAGPIMAQTVAYAPIQPSSDELLSPEMPVFQLLILADVMTAEEQIARLGLVYQDAESAETAASVLLDRLASRPSRSGDSYAKLLTPPNGSGPRHYVAQQSDQTVLVLEFPAPRATPEEIVAMLDPGGSDGTATRPGWVYGRLLNMFYQRDATWLSTQTR